jgi:hypothetical protein
MNSRWPSFVVLLGVLSMLLAIPSTSFAQGVGQGGGNQTAPGQNKGGNIPINQTATVNGAPAQVTGSFQITSFKNDNGCLEAVGHIRLKADGSPQQLDQDGVTLPVQSINGAPVPGNNCASAAGATTTDDTGASDLQIAQVATPGCNILNLVLGPLHLDLLGLVVDLNQLVLNVTGQTGAGDLLGNLLCGIAGLLNPAGALDLNVLTSLLNAVLAAL